MVIAHTGVKTTAEALTAMVTFYEAALAPLGYKKTRVFYDGAANGFSDNPDGNNADWWVSVANDGVPVKSHHAFVGKGMFSLLFSFCCRVKANFYGGIRSGGCRCVPQGWP
jgi:hypothetical protein